MAFPAPRAGGGPPAPVAPPPAPEGEVEDTEEEIDLSQNSIRLERTHDLYWVKIPTDSYWQIISRRERKRRNKSRMPVVLRNLAPDSIFDPRDAWAKEKQRRLTAAAEPAPAPAAAAASGGGGKGGKKKGGGGKGGGKQNKLSKKEEIALQNTQDKLRKQIAADWEKLDNAAKSTLRLMRNPSGKFSAIKEVLEMTVPATPVGMLRKLIMILDASLKAGDFAEAFDVLWAIETHPAFVPAEAEAIAYKEASSSEDGDKKSKKKSGGDKKKPDKKSMSQAAQLVHEFRKELKKARQERDRRDMIKFQLQDMHDRLPPLSKYNRVMRLDDWQCRVLERIDKNESAIVCAPTSSGKTVISTYVAIKMATAASGGAGGVLFIVPSEPLVWQVAAMFEKMHPGQVALATDLMLSRPEHTSDQADIVVGTPRAIESSLSKVRGKAGSELLGKKDYNQMLGGFGFRYAVFDEVHSLDGDEGAALQRLIRVVECPFLALSATVGNARALQSFWETVRGTHADVIFGSPSDEDPSRTEKRQPSVHLERHEGRFINIQRHMFRDNRLEPLHPCSALTLDLLRESTLDSLSISFTPRDTYALWEAFAAHITDRASIQDVDPTAFFSRFGPPQTHQITLLEAKEYESTLKDKLKELAMNEAITDQVQSVLAEFAVDPASCLPDFSLYEFARQCKASKLFPCLCFQLDTFQCVELFKGLLGSLESQQRIQHPDYHDQLYKQWLENQKKKKSNPKGGGGKKKRGGEDDEDDDQNGADADMEEEDTYIDVDAPHPEFVLTPPTTSLTPVEFEDILEEMSKDGEALPKTHPLARGLRRGIGMYVNDVATSVYRRVVQRLAQQGKLAIVFSDKSLAYGVNMPFRTCAFCGDMGDLLTPLMAQQMSGRSGRRGLDTQGNLVYLGMSWADIRTAILGKIPDIEGTEQLYPTMVLQQSLSEHVSARQMQNVCRPTFAAYLEDPADLDTRAGYYDMSSRLLEALGLIDEEQRPVAPFTGLTTMWELRDSIAESLTVQYALKYFMEEFVQDKPGDHAEKEIVQIDFFLRMCHMVDRTPPAPGTISLRDSTFIQKNAERTRLYDHWEGLLEACQNRYNNLPEEQKADLQARGAWEDLFMAVPPNSPIDGSVFEVFKTKHVPARLPSSEKFSLAHRLFRIGSIIRMMHNCLAQPGHFQKLELVLRKSFTRIRYILQDMIKNETSLQDESISAVRTGAAAEAAGNEQASAGGGGGSPADSQAAPS